jgi:hypothetical protein
MARLIRMADNGNDPSNDFPESTTFDLPERTEAMLFDEIISLPPKYRARLLEAVRLYELLESDPDLRKLRR